MFDTSGVQHRDTVGHGHGLDLVVRHVDHGGVQTFVQPADFGTGLHAKRCVEIAQWLVEQEDVRIADDGAADGDALALSAREFLGPPFEIRLHGEDPRGFLDLRIDFGLWQSHVLEAEGEVFGHRHMRIESVGLEDHGDAALGWCKRLHVAPVDDDLAARDFLEAGNHAQQCRLAASRWPDENHEFAVVDSKVDTLDYLDIAELLGYANQLQRGHTTRSFALRAVRPIVWASFLYSSI